MSGVGHLRGRTTHTRLGPVANRFTYGVDYVLVDAEAKIRGPILFSRNRRNLANLADRDHGGAPGRGRGASWVRETLAERQILIAGLKIELLAQPRILGHVFNPVSFWLCRDGGENLRAVIAEVTNTSGDRHCYLCRHADLRPILPSDRTSAEKLLHVSPFQPVAGNYSFRFDLRPDRMRILIDYRTETGGVVATLNGRLGKLTSIGLLGALLRRPFGSRRVLALIHWQALRLWWKGATYRPRPAPPKAETS